jgi:hypothetical protein
VKVVNDAGQGTKVRDEGLPRKPAPPTRTDRLNAAGARWLLDADEWTTGGAFVG